MSEHLKENLSAYLDEELDAPMSAAVERHLAECAECRADLEALRRIVRRAGSLDDRPPERDLWAGIASRIGSASTADVVPIATRRRVTFTLPQLAAAAVALMALSAGAVSLASRGTVRLPSSAASHPTIIAETGFDPGAATVASYDSAIAGMQQMLTTRRGALDTATVRVVEQSLAVVDLAIKQARDALARDPGNMYLNGQLQRTLDRKLDVLRQVVTLPLARS